ncbi:disease resistance protein At4g27190-like [Juglans regia]|uniref:Disease resistance protein At4g27190-like n=1 Tax=Juglans regia TaxID=51240 RepID=A0A6P9ETS8_JUGRE|nr:disease resistance protein At4g27190-like [Juglans regia]
MSGMELVAAPIVSVAVEETGRPLCRCIYSTIKNIVKSPVQQLDLLESHMKSLMVRRNDAAKEMEFAKREGRVIKGQANAWVGEVDELKRKCDQIQKAKSSRCFLSCIPKRYRISTKVAEHLKEIERLLEVGSSLAGSVAFNYSEVKKVEHIPGPSIQDQTTSVSEDVDKIMTLLSEDKNRIIGIWGMGGVGKTNLVRNLNNKLLENNSNLRFSCVIWVTVSKNLDIKGVQMRIASRLRLKLEESSGSDGMATQLHQSLLKEERFLLILDDVWEKIDLDKLGVPRLEDPRGSKIILTSRSLDVCRNMMLTDVDIKVSVLRDEDAWQLFSRYATDVVSLEHITPLAEAICKECKGFLWPSSPWELQ